MCVAFISKAQDSTLHQSEGIISTLRQKINSSGSNINASTDSLKQKLPTDTLKLPADTLGLSKWKTKLSGDQVDSLKRKIAGNKITSVPDSATKRISKPIDAIKNRSDSLQHKAANFVQQRIDSAEQKLAEPINKINSKISSVEKPLEEKIDGVNKSIDEKANKVQSGIQQGFEKATDGAVKAPTQNLDVPNMDLGKKPDVPGVDLQNPNIPGLDTDLQMPTIPKESVKVPDVNLDPGQLKQKATKPELKNLPDVKSEMEDVDSKLAELEKYEQELRGLKNFDSASVATATKKAEERIMNLEQMKGVQDQLKIAADKRAEYDALVQRYRDTTLTRQEFARKARNLVNEKINKNVPEVKEAMDALNKVKSAKEILNQKNNGLAGKPIGQRLIPGITLQSIKGDVFMIDFGLQLGYRLTGRLRSGVGGIYRLGFDESYNTFVKAQDIYGGRAYTEFLIRKGIYVHVEYELLNSPDYLSAAEARQNVSAGYFGIGKQFNISKKLKGHTLFMYRAELKGELPDQSKFNLRVGFDLRTDKKKRKL